jgi:hypothetical protein
MDRNSRNDDGRFAEAFGGPALHRLEDRESHNRFTANTSQIPQPTSIAESGFLVVCLPG